MGLLAQLLGIEHSAPLSRLEAGDGITLPDGTHLTWTEVAELTSTGEGPKILKAIDEAIAAGGYFTADGGDIYAGL